MFNSIKLEELGRQREREGNGEREVKTPSTLSLPVARLLFLPKRLVQGNINEQAAFARPENTPIYGSVINSKQYQGSKLTLANSQNASGFDNLRVRKISASKRLRVRIIHVCLPCLSEQRQRRPK